MQLRGTSADAIELAAQYAISHPFAKGKTINLGVATIGAGNAATADLDVAGYKYLTVLGRIGNATTPAAASGDLAVSICPYEDDGVTMFPPAVQATLAADTTIRAASFTAPYAYIALRFLVAGLDKVLTKIQNNNAGALQGGTLAYFLQK